MHANSNSQITTQTGFLAQQTKWLYNYMSNAGF